MQRYKTGERSFVYMRACADATVTYQGTIPS